MNKTFKLIRRVLAVILAATAVILLIVPAGNASASYTKDDFVIDNGCLVRYNGSASEITIPLGVNKIGKDAFSGNNNLKSVYIPDDVVTIDYAAFENCKNLEKVRIGEGVREIGASAFSGCQNLAVANIPRYVEKIGSGSFAACQSLSDISVDDNNNHFLCRDGVIYTRDGNKLVQYLAGRPYSIYDIPEPVTEIEEFAFFGANMLTDVNIVKGVKEISAYSFLNCSALSNVSIPSSVESIREGAFGGCPCLTSLAVPTSVSFIDDRAFTDLNGVTGDVVEENSGVVLSENNSDVINNSLNAVNEVNEVNEYTSANVQEAPNEQSNDNNETPIDSDTNNSSPLGAVTNLADKLKNVASNVVNEGSGVVDSTHIIGGQAIFMFNPKDLKAKGFDINNAQTEDKVADSVNVTPNGNIKDESGNEFDVINSVFGHYGGNSSDIVIPEGVTNVGNRIFYNKNNINSVRLPGTTERIGDFAFARSSVNSIDIPNGTKSIGYAAFYNCKNLADCNIPSSVESIELGAFDGSKYLADWKKIENGNDFLIVGDGILLAYKGFGGKIEIPDGVKTIGPGVFENNTSITDVKIPNSVVKIGEDAFNGCARINSIILPDNVKVIEDRAFKNTNLNSVIIPGQVEKIGLAAFDTTDVNRGLSAVVFRGTKLPDMTYKPTASRLSAKLLRTNAFEGCEQAIIPADTPINSGNIFDTNQYGFRGSVYSIKSSNIDEGIGTCELRKCSVEPLSNGEVMITPVMESLGKKYNLSGIRESAFNDYANNNWSKNPVSSIKVKGDVSDSLKEMIDSIPINNIEKKPVTSENDLINISTDNTFGSSGNIRARIPDNKERYNLSIVSDESKRGILTDAFNNRYGSSDNINMKCLSIDLKDENSVIDINKLSTKKLEISLSVPNEFSMISDIKIATVDDNGVLENVTSNVTGDGNNRQISFVANHLSPYAIYYFSDSVLNEELDSSFSTTFVSNEESLSKTVENVAIQTLSKTMPSTPARVFVAIILLCLAAILVLIDFKKKNKV